MEENSLHKPTEDSKSTDKSLKDLNADMGFHEDNDISGTSFDLKSDHPKESKEIDLANFKLYNSEVKLKPLTLHDIGKVGLSHASKIEPMLKSLTKDASTSRTQLLTIFQSVSAPENLVEVLKTYKPLSKEMEVSLINKSKFWKVRRYKNAIYYGELHNSQRHGKGIMLYQNMSIYEGDWENNIKHGKGVEMTSQGAIYEGDYKNGKPEGKGTFMWPSGEIYEGEWKHGNKHGNGMWKGKKGESYVGEWALGKQEGYGVFTWRNGERYEGHFLNYLKHGQGKEKFANGDYYVGNYLNGKPNGHGEYFWVDGRHYVGMFSNGMRHGKGVWRAGVGQTDTYDGEWMNDKKCGYGVYQWKVGNSYKGNYFDDMREGYGEMFWADGSSYKGKWHKGDMHGNGTMILQDQEPLEGIFDNGVFIGTKESYDARENLKNVFTDSAHPISTEDSNYFSYKKPALEKANRNQDSSYVSDKGGNEKGAGDTAETVGSLRFEKKETIPRSATRLPRIGSTKPMVRFRTSSQKDIIRDKSEESTRLNHSEVTAEVEPKEYICAKCRAKIAIGITNFRGRASRGGNMSYIGPNEASRSKLSSQKGSSRMATESPESAGLYCKRCDARKNHSPNPEEREQTLEYNLSNLSRKEVARLNVMKDRRGVDWHKLRNLNDPIVCDRIRKLMEPNKWRFNDCYKVQSGKSGFGEHIPLAPKGRNKKLAL